LTAHSEDDDDALVRRAADGDASAWPILVARHATMLVRCAWRVLGDRGEAEDVAQESFVRLMAKARSWQADGAPLKTWLYRVALNLSIDRVRARRTTSIEAVAEPSDEGRAATSFERALDRKRRVRLALADLPERQRTAIALVHYEGLSQQEAATILSLSVDALESLLARGRRRLREQLADVAEDLMKD
jgi:RNA polymerase sigma-70 factor (ECF subfamily)